MKLDGWYEGGLGNREITVEAARQCESGMPLRDTVGVNCKKS